MPVTSAPVVDQPTYLLVLALAVIAAVAGYRVRTRLTGRRRRVASSADGRFQHAFDTAPTGMSVLAVSGRYLRVNKALCDLLGYDPDQLMNITACDITHPDDLSYAKDRMADVVAGRLDRWETEKRYRHADGHWVWAFVSWTVFRASDGRPRHIVSHVVDISERKDAQAALAHQALHDALTGLPNRASLRDSLECALRRHAHDPCTIAVLFVDLDRFKLINDSLGHAVGDEVLSAAVERLMTVLRAKDTPARFGGDEFVVLCDGLSDASEAAAIAGRVVGAFERPLLVSAGPMFVTVSVGIALASATDTDPDLLLTQADAALHRAKQAGRGRFEVFDAQHASTAINQLTTANDLRRAIAHGELRLHYQPEVDVSSGEVLAVEALMRWEHPHRGLLSPERFIPVAEEAGLMEPLTRWALNEAGRQIRAWHDEAGFFLPIWVNVSPSVMNGPGVVALVGDVLSEWQLPADVVGLEFTESAVMDDVSSTAFRLRRLREIGVRLAIDDFGTGYSSLSYLKRLPVDTLKIDRSFIAGVGRLPEDTAIVEAVLAVSRALGLTAVAEGVETEVQAAALAQLGCSVAQGYLYCRPVGGATIGALLKDSAAGGDGGRPAAGPLGLARSASEPSASMPQ